LLDDSKETKLKRDFNVPDKRYWWLKIAAFAKRKRWDLLEEFSKKKSPIGYKPFVEACIKQGALMEALKYIPKISDPWEKMDIYIELNLLKEAIELGYQQRNIEMLYYIRDKCGSNVALRSTIDEILSKLGV